MKISQTDRNLDLIFPPFFHFLQYIFSILNILTPFANKVRQSVSLSLFMTSWLSSVWFSFLSFCIIFGYISLAVPSPLVGTDEAQKVAQQKAVVSGILFYFFLCIFWVVVTSSSEAQPHLVQLSTSKGGKEQQS